MCDVEWAAFAHEASVKVIRTLPLLTGTSWITKPNCCVSFACCKVSARVFKSWMLVCKPWLQRDIAGATSALIWDPSHCRHQICFWTPYAHQKTKPLVVSSFLLASCRAPQSRGTSSSWCATRRGSPCSAYSTALSVWKPEACQSRKTATLPIWTSCADRICLSPADECQRSRRHSRWWGSWSLVVIILDSEKASCQNHASRSSGRWVDQPLLLSKGAFGSP